MEIDYRIIEGKNVRMRKWRLKDRKEEEGRNDVERADKEMERKQMKTEEKEKKSR